MKSKFNQLAIALSLILLSSASAFPQALATLSNHTPKEVREGTAPLVGHYNPMQMLRLAIGLTHPHVAEEKQLIEELHDRKSPNFQHFLTPEEWNKRFAPSAEDEQSVVDWAQSQGFSITNRFANRLLVDVEAPAGQIEKALGVTLNNYQVRGKRKFSNDRDPALPAFLIPVVQSVMGLNNIAVSHTLSRTHFSQPLNEVEAPDYVAGPARSEVFSIHSEASSSQSNANYQSAASYTPADLPTIGGLQPADLWSFAGYNFAQLLKQSNSPLFYGSVLPSVSPSHSIAIAIWGAESQSDLQTFTNTFGVGADFFDTDIDGTGFSDTGMGEGTFDAEWAMAMAPAWPVYVYNGPDGGDTADVLNAILSDNKAHIVSMSWGSAEQDAAYQTYTQDGIFSAMVAQGFTLVAASGDQGATSGCTDALQVLWPASNPNVVAAAGTELILGNNNTSFTSEIAWSGNTAPGSCAGNAGGSTGGFSRIYAAPSYQSSFGYAHRSVPDIALNAINESFYYQGAWGQFSGTSAAAPKAAAFFALANSYLDYISNLNNNCAAEGHTCSGIGNANYFLYEIGNNPTSVSHYPFYDITSGCNSNDITVQYGLTPYCAQPGYDQVTGWGSFNALQLAWAINALRVGGGPPTVTFPPSKNATPGIWTNVSPFPTWDSTATAMSGLPVGLAGYSIGEDANPPPDTFKLGRPTNNSPVYDGFFGLPTYSSASEIEDYQLPNFAIFIGDGSGCHTFQIREFDNAGYSTLAPYGPICYDPNPPKVVPSFAGTKSSTGSFQYNSSVTVTLSSTDDLSGVAATYYTLDGVNANALYSGPFAVSGVGQHNVSYYAVDYAGNTSTVASTSFGISYSSASSAKYSGLDTKTQGNWAGKYGGDAYFIPSFYEQTAPYISYLTAIANQNNWTFTSDVRALQEASGRAAGYFSPVANSPTTITMNLNIIDGNTHRLALYLLDWNNSGEAETISILDAASSAVLDTESFSNFQNGQYAVWNIKGNVTIKVTGTAGPSPLVSGLFLDTTPASSAAVKWVGTDSTTQGTWTGKYGLDGYDVVYEGGVIPTYLTQEPFGGVDYIWAVPTTDPRAPQTAPGSSNRAATGRQNLGSLVYDFNDGKTHRLAFYLLDWNNTGLSETISILDFTTHTVLDTETFSNFQNGVYAIWNVTGTVIIEINAPAGENSLFSAVFFDPVTSSSNAQYSGTNVSTEGTWTGNYGADGYFIANKAAKLPAYATVTLAGDATYSWAASTIDPRALQTASGASARIASTFYSATTETINLNLTDGNAHRVALYLLDWDSTARVETIQIVDAASNFVLDTESYASFHGGEYAVWTVQGHVLIKVTRTAGSNAVVSGIFFDPLIKPGAHFITANLIGTDTATQGAWTGKYGSHGYLIANERTSNPPAFATVAITASSYTWAASTSDPRALQTASGATTKIASTYYSGTTETIDLNLTDGDTHKISLYLLDWDSTSRAETITILDAATKDVLSTQSLSGFHSGVYAPWIITGHVLIQITKTGGANAVVSGIFFD